MYALLLDKKYYFYIKIQLQKAKGRKRMKEREIMDPTVHFFPGSLGITCVFLSKVHQKLSKAEQKEDHDHHREKDILIL